MRRCNCGSLLCEVRKSTLTNTIAKEKEANSSLELPISELPITISYTSEFPTIDRSHAYYNYTSDRFLFFDTTRKWLVRASPSLSDPMLCTAITVPPVSTTRSDIQSIRRACSRRSEWLNPRSRDRLARTVSVWAGQSHAENLPHRIPVVDLTTCNSVPERMSVGGHSLQIDAR